MRTLVAAAAATAALLALLACQGAAARRLAEISSCSEARMYCYNSVCSRQGVRDFDCDAPGLFSSGSYSCQCNPTSWAAQCFPGSAMVTTQGRGAVRLADLAAGERVLAVGPRGALQFDQVFMFSSRRPQEEATFVRIVTDTGANLTVTPGHYLFAWPAAHAARAEAALQASPAAWPYVLPSKVKRGDLMPVAAGGRVRLARILAVERVVDTGIFMPHTWSGAIVVDGVAATELTSIVPPSLAGHRFHAAFAAVMRSAFRLLPPHVVEAAVGAVSSWAHGTADASTMPAAAVLGGSLAWGITA